jgi:two-component system, sensor histidine kinase
MLGHELRNPLGTIVLASEAWQERGSEKMAANLQLIARQSGHLTRLVDDLLEVARVTQGKVRLQREAVDTVALIDGCIANLSSRFQAHKIAISSTLTPAVIDADPVRLEQIVNNLLTNALKYSRENTEVRVITTVRDGVWEMRVRDQGIGIAPEMLPRVFDLFAQADRSLRRADGGMGIGLTLVARLVGLHGGTVQATSAGIGKGSEFVVTMAVGDPRPTAVAKPPAVHTGAPISVVLVEDNADLRELSKSLLETFGCHVEVAGDGNQGLELILSTKPALAIVDIGLPGLDGFSIAERVRRSLGNSLTMVAVTGFGQQYDRERALASGFDVHVIKPLRSAAVHSMIDRARANAR